MPSARQIQTMYQTWILEIHFSNTFPPAVGRPSCLSKFWIKTCILLSYMHATCPAHFMLHNLFGLRILAKSKIMPLLIKPCSTASQYFCPAWSSISLCTLNLGSSLNANRPNASEQKRWNFHIIRVLKLMHIYNPETTILDFKLSPWFEYCIYSFGYFPGVKL